MNIRVANEHDISEICTLVKSLSYFYLDDSDAELPSWLLETLTEKSFLNRIQSSGFDNYVYETDSGIVGYISLKRGGHLYHLFVSKNQQRRGISRSLWEHIISKHRYDVYTLRSSMFAVPVYKKFGFKLVGEAGEKEGISFQPMALRL